MKIYYDGNAIKKYKDLDFVEGFTSNTSYASQSDNKDYRSYIEDFVKEANGRSCSFQGWSDDDEEILRQAKEITSFGPNVFVKIPIIKLNGNNNLPVLNQVLDLGLKVNVTAIHTIEQIDLVLQLLPRENPMIVSVFAGGITDAGVDPKPIMKHAVNIFRSDKNIEILWAGCQTNLHVVEARECGCQIITIPDAVMNKLDRMKNSLLETSLLKVKKFMEDGISIPKKF